MMKTVNKNVQPVSNQDSDDIWNYFYLNDENYEKILSSNLKGISKDIAILRKENFKHLTSPIGTTTNENRQLLKEYYETKRTVTWIATVGDVSLPKGRQAGNLLLYHVVMSDKNQNIPVSIDCRNTKYNLIDHHLWLRISDIKYFGDKDSLKLSFGDVIMGTSYIKEYKRKDGEISYTLGATSIIASGFITGKVNIGERDWGTISNAKIRDYDHSTFALLELSYTKKATRKIKQAKSTNIEDLAKCKYYLTTDYKKWNTYNFHDSFNSPYLSQLRTETTQELIKQREYEIYASSFITITLKLIANLKLPEIELAN